MMSETTRVGAIEPSLTVVGTRLGRWAAELKMDGKSQRLFGWGAIVDVAMLRACGCDAAWRRPYHGLLTHEGLGSWLHIGEIIRHEEQLHGVQFWVLDNQLYLTPGWYGVT